MVILKILDYVVYRKFRYLKNHTIGVSTFQYPENFGAWKPFRTEISIHIPSYTVSYHPIPKLLKKKNMYSLCFIKFVVFGLFFFKMFAILQFFHVSLYFTIYHSINIYSISHSFLFLRIN